MSEKKVSVMVSNWRTEVRRGALQLYLLSLIRKNHEMYGYQIVKELKEKTGPIFEIKEGVLYPILRRLEKDKILESTWRTPMNGVQKPRKYYNLSKKGYQVLDEMTQYWDGLAYEMDLILKEEYA